MNPVTELQEAVKTIVGKEVFEAVSKLTDAQWRQLEDIRALKTPELSLEQALARYLEAIKADYRKWSNTENMNDYDRVNSVRGKMTKEFEEGLTIEEGQVYLKVITTRSGSSRSVHSFIVKEDGPKFKRGDILKAASWKAPAKNQARGNIFGEYRVRWTGAEYLR